MADTDPWQSNQRMGGEISPTNGLREAFNRILSEKEVQEGILRILSRSHRGCIGIFCSRYITGAGMATEKLTGFTALSRLLSVRTGMYAFVPSHGNMKRLQQSLAVDIYQLLETRSSNDNQDPAPPLEEALAMLIKPSDAVTVFAAEELPEGERLEVAVQRMGESYGAWTGEMPVMASWLSALVPSHPRLTVQPVGNPEDQTLTAAPSGQPDIRSLEEGNAHEMCREFGTGLSQKDLDSIPTPSRAPGQIKGKAVLGKRHIVIADIEKSLERYSGQACSANNKTLPPLAEPAQEGAGAIPEGLSMKLLDSEYADDCRKLITWQHKRVQVDPKSFIHSGDAVQNLRHQRENKNKVILVISAGFLLVGCILTLLRMLLVPPPEAPAAPVARIAHPPAEPARKRKVLEVPGGVIYLPDEQMPVGRKQSYAGSSMSANPLGKMPSHPSAAADPVREYQSLPQPAQKAVGADFLGNPGGLRPPEERAKLTPEQGAHQPPLQQTLPTQQGTKDGHSEQTSEKTQKDDQLQDSTTGLQQQGHCVRYYGPSSR